MASGGQRIAQVICYLQTPSAGGETKFFDRAFGGLQVEPKLGSALIFPTATLRGEADERYLHSGEPVKRGTKWIVGTWLMEAERTDGDDVAEAIDQLWKMAGVEPPPKKAAKQPSAAAASGAAAGGGVGAAAGGKSKKGGKQRKKKRR